MCQAWAATHVFVSCRQAWVDKHGQPSMGRQQAWAAKHGQTSMGQLEQLGAAKRGVLHQPKGRTKLHSINRELHTHSEQKHTFTSSITLIHTFRFTTKREGSLELSWELPCCHHLVLLLSLSYLCISYFLYS